METTVFPQLEFQGKLRPSQNDVVKIARSALQQEERQLYIVAPPGAGKTVLGLYLWAECIQGPAIVLSPNSAIQAQWAARTSLFKADGRALTADDVSTDPSRPGLLTSLTYQSITLPERRNSNSDLAATAIWVESLVDQGHAETPEAANAWIDDLKHRNHSYFNQRLSRWRKQSRDAAAMEGRSIEQLHTSSQDTLQRLKDSGVRTIILDECHHLVGHWGRVLTAVDDFLDQPIIIGLTATPPGEEGHKSDDIKRYQSFFGGIDYEVPVPAVVRDGFLAPYQDLAWFVSPTEREHEFVAATDEAFRTLLDELCQPRSGVGNVPCLPDWLEVTLQNLDLPGHRCKSWSEFRKRDRALADAARLFLAARGRGLPDGIAPIHSREIRAREESDGLDLPLDVLLTVIDRYVRHGLRRSASNDDQQLCDRSIDRIRLLGWQITETGSRSCASPITRVLGHTHNKMKALVPILTHEMEQLDDSLRAVVITDYEKASALSADVGNILDEDAGGAMAAFREVVANQTTNTLDPILLTGSTILVDHDLADLFLAASEHWLVMNQYNVSLELQDEKTFHVVQGSGRDWCPRVYIQMVTQLFQDGITRCLIGTRALLGEGWDANRINVLIDLTIATTSMTVNQLRGRSIRLDPHAPEKVANNWDVVCVAPRFARGMDDYQRFCRKHETIFGVTDDGAIEKGVGHVHPALTPQGPRIGDRSLDDINAEMLSRAADRARTRRLWKTGNELPGSVTQTVEITFTESDQQDFLGGFRNPSALAQSVASAVLEALEQTSQVQSGSRIRMKSTTDRVKLWLANASDIDGQTFAEAVADIMSPFQRPRYIIPRTSSPAKTAVSRWMPTAIGEFFAKPVEHSVMYHAVPQCLARNRSLVDIFESSWKRKVSDAEAVSTRSAAGEQLLETVIANGHMMTVTARVVECFL